MDRASGGSNTPRLIANKIFDFKSAMSVIITMETGEPDDDERERLERFGEVWIIDEMDDFGFDFVQAVENVRESCGL